MLDNAECSCLVRFEKLFGAQSTNTTEKITFGWGCESETSDGECSFQSEVLWIDIHYQYHRGDWRDIIIESKITVIRRQTG